MSQFQFVRDNLVAVWFTPSLPEGIYYGQFIMNCSGDIRGTSATFWLQFSDKLKKDYEPDYIAALKAQADATVISALGAAFIIGLATIIATRVTSRRDENRILVKLQNLNNKMDKLIKKK